MKILRVFCILCFLSILSFVYSNDHLIICDDSLQFQAPSIEYRVTNRSYPSIFQASQRMLTDGSYVPIDDDISTAMHDLIFSDFVHFERAYVRPIISDDQPYYGLASQIGMEFTENAQEMHRTRISLNPNHLNITWRDFQIGEPNYLPDDFDLYLRSDIHGGKLKYNETLYYLDILHPDIQSLIVSQIVGYANCGLYDGIMIDSFTYYTNERGGRIDPDAISQEMGAQLVDAFVSILSQARKQMPNDFLILVNGGYYVGELDSFTDLINGSFMECARDRGIDYTRDNLIEVENTLTWNEKNLRYPQVNCVEGFGHPKEPPDSPKNKKWMRVFTTLTLTHSNGYVLFNRGGFYIGGSGHNHIWYDFWDANLGTPVGDKSQLYDNRDGVFIREFARGWAVYNRSGSEQEIEFGSHVSGKSSEITATSHVLPDLDGEIYLKTLRIDINQDGVVNILDLVIVANKLGEQEPDLNDDGIVNILDLILVAGGMK